MALPLSRMVQRYRCMICEKGGFTQVVHCERHMTSSHSGFGYQCSACLNVLGRNDQTQKCKKKEICFNLKLVKRSTMTLTPDESAEFESFQRKRNTQVHTYMEKLSVPTSEQPFGTKERPGNKRKIQYLEEIPVPSKLKKNLTEISEKNEEIRKKAEETEVEPENRAKACRRLFRDQETLSDTSESESEEEEEEEPKLKSPQVYIEEPKRTVITETTEEYDIVEKREEKEEKNEDGPLAILIKMQTSRVTLNVGGKLFETSKVTVAKYPNSLLHKLISNPEIQPFRKSSENVPIYFIDRSPQHFGTILEFLRVGNKEIESYLPNNPIHLKQLFCESLFYGLDDLASITAERSCKSLFGVSISEF